MKTTINHRRTCVAVYGMSFKEWREWKGWIKGGLQSMHMGWSFISGAFSNAAELVDYIDWNEDLEIVYFHNNGSDQKLLKDVKVIAEAICRHQHKPWVVLDKGFEYLLPVLKEKGIEVEGGILEHVIHERWASQVDHAMDAA